MGVDKKRTRRIVYRILVVILILFFVAAYLRYLDLKKKFISAVSERATSLIGQRVHIKDVSVSSSGTINLYGITVENPEGFHPGRLLRVKSVHLNMRLAGLLRGGFSFRDIVLQSPELTLVKDEKGKLNVSDALMRFLSEESEAKYSYEVEEFRIDSGIFDFNKDQRYRSSQIELLLKNLSSNPGTKTELKGVLFYAGNRMEMSGWTYLKDKPKRVNVSILSKDFAVAPFIKSLPEKRMTMAVHVEGGFEEGFHIKSDIQTKSVGFPPFAEGLQDIHLTADAVLSLRDDSLAVHSATLYANGFSVASFKGLLSDLKKKPSYRIEVKIEKFDLSRFYVAKDLKIDGILISRNLFVTGNFERGIPKISGGLELRDGGMESHGLIVKNVRADATFLSGKEISVRGQASGNVLQVRNDLFEKPVHAALSASLQTVQRRLLVTSIIRFSPLEMKTKGGETVYFDGGSVTLDGAIEDRAFSGRNSFEIKSVRYADHILDGFKGGFLIDYGHKNFEVKSLTIETKDIRLSANRARIVLSGIKPDYAIDISGMSASYLGGEALLKEADAYLFLSPVGKSFSGDLRFTAGTFLFKGIAAGHLSATSKFDEKNFYVDISRADVSGGRITLTASGRTSEGPFPITGNLVVENVALGSLSESGLKLLNLRYRMAGDINRVTFEGTIHSRESVFGQGLLNARNISVLNPGTGRNIVKDASFNGGVEFNGRDLFFKVEASVGTLFSRFSGTLTEFMGKGRHLKVTGILPDVKLTDIRNSLWDIFPDSLLYAKLDGSMSSGLSIDYSKDRFSAEAKFVVKDGILGGENGEYLLGPINGTIPIRYGKVGEKEEMLPFPSFQKSQFENLQIYYSREVRNEGFDRVTIGSLMYGFQFFDSIELLIRQGSGFDVERFSANIFGGKLSGSAVIDISNGLQYKAGLLVKGLSLRKLCDSIKPLKGFISGKLDGVGMFKGSGTGLSALIGKADFWTYPTHDEKTIISKEFLQKIAGASMKAYLGNRPFDKGVMTVYVQNGDLTFEELEISNRNLLGMTDLSIKVAPFSNRIALNDFLWSITEAAERTKKKE